jgi:hypothetical protein
MPISNNGVTWLNANQGLVSVLIFLLTILLAWISGIFKAIRQRPVFKISTIPGPTFCTTIETGNESNGFKHTRTGISIYLRVANIGNAPSDIERVSIGFKWQAIPFTSIWFKYVIGWFWLEHSMISMEDFRRHIKDKVRIYPFLIQRSYITNDSGDTYLEIGKGVSGIVYFETVECWGACRPGIFDSKTRVKIAVHDVFGKKHYHTCQIPVVDIETAQKWNPSFLSTYDHLEAAEGEPDAT